MPFPRFLTPAPARGGASPTSASLAVAGGGGLATTLAFTIQQQLQSDWCWAAVTASVADYYRPGTPWTQCGIADAALGRNDCCTTGGSDPAKCNKPFYLETALDITGHLARIEPRPLTVVEVQAEIAQARPLGCRIEWPGGTGHFLTVVGCFIGPSGDAYLDVADPIFLDSQIPFRDFAALYQTGASWTHSYLTTRAAAGGAAPMAASQPRRPLHPDAIGA